MAINHHYSGLTDNQVLESRAKYGVNVFTPPEKETMWDKFKDACSHWISIMLGILLVLSIVAAAMLCGSLGASIWVMPTIIAVSTLLIVIVGFSAVLKSPSSGF